jgi:hypothetical protein
VSAISIDHPNIIRSTAARGVMWGPLKGGFLVGLLFLLLQLATVWAQPCPNRCSGHGACGAEGVCICETGWTLAADCSMRVRAPTVLAAAFPEATPAAGWVLDLRCNSRPSFGSSTALAPLF